MAWFTDLVLYKELLKKKAQGVLYKNIMHHIKPHRGDQKLFWDRSNWQPLCEHHHNVKSMTEDRYKEYRF